MSDALATVLIVDDEPLARDTLRLLLEARADVTIVGEAVNGSEAVEAIRSLRPDVVLLDIQMPVMNGFEVIEAVGVDRMPTVIFATAFDEYALKAFEAHALDYLLKPFDDDRFDAALDRAVERVQRNRRDDLGARLERLLSERTSAPVEADEALPRQGRILVRDRDRIQLVDVDAVQWIEAAGDYVVLHTDGKRHMIRGTMAAMEQRLDPQRFVRIHRSNIVNLDFVTEIRPYFHGDYMVYLQSGRELKLSRRYWPAVESRFNPPT